MTSVEFLGAKDIPFCSLFNSKQENKEFFTMSLWLSHSSLMRPEIPDWLEELAQKVAANDPRIQNLELTHQRIDDAQARFLATALEDNTRIRSFILSCFSIYDDGAISLASVLGKSGCLQKVQLRDIRTSREMNIFFESLLQNKSVEEFSLRHCQIAIPSAKILSGLLKSHHNLQEIRLVDTQIPAISFSYFCSGIKDSVSIRRLYLINAEIDGESGARSLGAMLRRNTSLHEVHLSENELGDEGAAVLVDGLLFNSTLMKLDLRSNGIGGEGALSLASLIKQSPSLTSLYVGMNSIGNVGAEALARGLANSRLEKLDLSDNGIGVSGAQAISQMLCTNTNLQELNLSFNNIGDDGASYIANILDRNVTLRCLSLRRNYINNKGAYAFAVKLPFMNGLKELVMTKNSVSKEGALALLDGLRGNMELEYLHVEEKASEPILREIFHWISLNRAGRRIFRNAELPATLWPTILSNSNDNIEVLYHFLRQKPEIL